MAKGEERRMKRREAILDVGVLYQEERKMLRGCCYKAERGIVWLGSHTSDILFWVPTTVFQVPFLEYSVLSVTCECPGNPRLNNDS